MMPVPADLLAFYERHLLDEVMPFWYRYALDPVHGGVFTCLNDQGDVLHDRKFTWSQGRALYTFARLYDEMGHDPRWLEASNRVAGFLFAHSPPPSRAWPFCFTRAGAVSEPRASIYADAFVLLGCVRYYRMTGDSRAWKLAVDIARRIEPLLAHAHHSLPVWPHHVPPGCQAHGPLMIYANAFAELHDIAPHQGWAEQALRLARRIMREHVRQDEGVLLEFVAPGGGRLRHDAGCTYLPGHAIESMWFLVHIFQQYGDPAEAREALTVIKWHLERGWDEAWGGLFLACHTGRGMPAWHAPDSKIWWPHTESLYALLLARIEGAPWAWIWYKRMHDYTFTTFPCRSHGDWRQNLNRYGQPIPIVVKGLQVKDPFHLPRSLLNIIDLLRRHQTSPAPPGVAWPESAALTALTTARRVR